MQHAPASFRILREARRAFDDSGGMMSGMKEHGMKKDAMKPDAMSGPYDSGRAGKEAVTRQLQEIGLRLA
jgi:hypothetical protein